MKHTLSISLVVGLAVASPAAAQVTASAPGTGRVGAPCRPAGDRADGSTSAHAARSMADGRWTDAADAQPMAPMAPMPPMPPMPAMAPMPLMPPMPPMKLGPGAGFDYQDREAERQDREREQKEREIQRAQAERDRESSLYEQGNNAIYEGRWDRAVTYFTRLADLKGTRADSALYWKSYAQNRLGQRADALSTIAELTKSYPNSRYLKEAKALEVEVRGRRGQPVRPEAQADEELKLIAINALANSDPAQAVPLLEKLLSGTGVAAAQGPGALRAGADQHAARPRGPDEHRQGQRDTGAAEPRDSVSRRPRRPREPRHARRDLRLVDRRRRQAPHPARVHGGGRKGPPADRGADRTEPGAARRGGPAARRDGRQRRALADVPEGNVGRRQAVHPVGHAGQRQFTRA